MKYLLVLLFFVFGLCDTMLPDDNYKKILRDGLLGSEEELSSYYRADTTKTTPQHHEKARPTRPETLQESRSDGRRP